MPLNCQFAVSSMETIRAVRLLYHCPNCQEIAATCLERSALVKQRITYSYGSTSSGSTGTNLATFCRMASVESG